MATKQKRQLGCWLKTLGGTFRLRDGKAPTDEVKLLGPEPQWFAKLCADDFRSDPQIVVHAEAPPTSIIDDDFGIEIDSGPEPAKAQVKPAPQAVKPEPAKAPKQKK